MTTNTEARRQDGTLTKRAQAARLADIDSQIAEVQDKLRRYDAAWGTWTGALPEHIADNWNDLHDAETALKSERREVELNRSIHRTETDRLIAANID